MIDDASLRGVNIIEKERAALSTMGDEIRSKAALLLTRSLETSNIADASTALLVFHNLGELPQRVVAAIDALRARVDATANAIAARTAVAQTSSAAVVAVAATQSTAGESAFRTALWSQIDAWTEEAFVAVTRCDHLQRALSKQRDPMSRRTLFSELLHVVKVPNSDVGTSPSTAPIAMTTLTPSVAALAGVLGDAGVTITQTLWRSVVHTLEARISRVAGETGLHITSRSTVYADCCDNR